ncbi:transposase, partial [Solemya velum gill symbiont]
MLGCNRRTKKSRYSETQIVRILKEVEAGKVVKDVCR